MSLFTKRFLVIVFLIISIPGYAGTIKGVLTDKKTGEPVVGATVALKGTTYGTNTGLDGSYTLRNVPAGSYDFVASFISMETYTQHITLTETQTLEVNYSLAPVSNTLDEVEIKAKLKKGSEEEARNVEKNSDNLMNAISARYIEILPDITIANVLQRVSGVTVERNANGDARYAIIRGMDKRYNYTTVNGVKIPSPDDKMRYVPMDIFPAELVERLEVIKSLTPDMEGDAVGGVMNLQMKSAPDHLVAYASVATGYNQTLFDRQYQGFPKSGFSLKDPLQNHGNGYSAVTSDFQTRTGDIRSSKAPANGLMSFTVGDRFLKSKKLGVVLSGSYQNTYKGSDVIFFQPSLQPGLNNAPAITDLYVRKYSTNETRTGIHTKVDYEFNKKNTISLYGLFLQLDELQNRYVIDTTVQINRVGAGTGPVSLSDRAAFRRQTIGNLTLQGNHLITNNFKIDYSLVYSLAKMEVPDMTELKTSVNVSIDSTGHPAATGPYFKSFSHSWENTNDEDRSVYLNFTYTPNLFGQNIEFKAGGLYRSKNRDNRYNDYTLQSASPNQPFTSIYAAQMSVKQPTGDLNDTKNYAVTEEISAGYIQAKTDISDLQVLAGVRTENTHNIYHMNIDVNQKLGTIGELNYTDVLPSVHLKYALDKKQNLRFSYFESISRPGFFEVVPYSFGGEDWTELGNYYLNHAVAQNFDLRYEWFPKGIDQLLAGAFYKDISNPIEYAVVSAATGVSAGDLKPVNVSDKAVNYGAEFVITKYFHYFGVSANYTYTHSSVTANELSRLADSTGAPHNYAVTYTRPLQGQSAHVANLALIYKNPKLGFDAHLSWVYTGRRIALISQFVGSDYWQRATSFFDFSCEKRIVKRISIYAKVNNLLNTSVYWELEKSKEPFLTGTYSLPYQTLKDNILVKKENYGRNYLLGIRFKLN